MAKNVRNKNENGRGNRYSQTLRGKRVRVKNRNFK